MMKKLFLKLISAVLAILMLSFLLAACREQNGGSDTTEASPHGSSDEPTNRETESETGESGSEALSSETESETETEDLWESDSLLKLSMALGKNMKRVITSINQSKAELCEIDDGREVLRLSTSVTEANDPYAMLNFPAFMKSNGSSVQDMVAEDFPHILLRIKADTAKSSGFELFYCTDDIRKATTGYSEATLFDPEDDGWQYIYFDLENSNYKGKINSFRFDYLTSASEIGESVIISDMIFAKTEEDAFRVMGLTLNPEEYESTSANETETYEEVAELPADAVLDKYDLNTAMTSIWEGPIVYNEPIMFVGKEDIAPLIYQADHVFSVRSFDLKTEYEENVDYIVTEDGKLKLTDNTRIPVMSFEEYYPNVEGGSDGTYKSSLGEERPYVKNSELMHRWQVLVTYSHRDGWSGYIPKNCSDNYSKTNAKLQNGEECKILFYGDSITEGASSSGFFNHEPYQPKWSQMVCDHLTSRFENSNVEHINTGLGGKGVSWGTANAEERIIAYKPDLVVIGFGMNDGAVNALSHAKAVAKIVRAVKDALPDTEILIIATMLPNEESAAWKNQCDFEEMYLRYFGSFYPDVSVVRMSTVHRELVNTKKFYHLTGNNVNHPNDFIIRAYAQAVVRTIAGDCGE